MARDGLLLLLFLLYHTMCNIFLYTTNYQDSEINF